MKKMGFILYITENDSNVGAMFEIINNRGKPLSQLEKIKNYLIYFSTLTNSIEIKERLNASWGNILKNLMKSNKITNEDENSFLRYLWVVFSKTQIKTSYDIYALVKEEFPIDYEAKNICIEDLQKRIKDFIKFLTFASEAYFDLYNKKNKVYINLRNQRPIVPILPLFISIFCNKIITDIEKETLYKVIEILNFRVYVLPTKRRSDAGQSILFNIAFEFNNGILKSENFEESSQFELLKKKLTEFTKENSSEKQFVENLTLDIGEKYDYYKWNTGLKYFLANYEVSLAKSDNQTENIEMYINPQGTDKNDTQEKEHIWAQNNRPEENKGKKTQESDKKHINSQNKGIATYIENSLHQKSRLGNFVLLHKRTNVMASKHDLKKFDEKKVNPNKCDLKDGIIGKLDIYLAFGKQNRQVTKLIDFHNQARGIVEDSSNYFRNRFFDYYQKIIDLNEEEYINFALNRWKLDNEKFSSYTVNSKLAEVKYNENNANINVFFKKNEVSSLLLNNCQLHFVLVQFCS